jgi:hypothetical protein
MRVALLVDYPVLMRAVRAIDADAMPRLDLLVRRAGVLGPVLVSRAYGAWYDKDEALNAFTSGIDPVFVPPAGPGSVPSTSAVVTDGLSMIRSGQAQALALSGDDRLLPLITVAHAEGLPIALLAHSCRADGPCIPLATLTEPVSAFIRPITRAERYRRAS